MSKRKNRLLREMEARYRESRNPHFIQGAMLSGIPGAVDDLLDKVEAKPQRR